MPHVALVPFTGLRVREQELLSLRTSVNRGRPYGDPSWVQSTAKLLLWAVVFFALVSMIQYFREFWSKLDNSIKYRERRRLKVLKRKRRWAAERRELGRLRKLEQLQKQESGGEPPPRADS